MPSKEIETAMPYKHGEICEHDSLKRKCDVCWLQWEKDEWQKRALQAESDASTLATEVLAWRDFENEVGGLRLITMGQAENEALDKVKEACNITNKSLALQRVKDINNAQ